MIVEYLGAPGCGKTFHANLFKKSLKEKGISYMDISRHKGMPLYLKVLYKFWDYSILLIPKYRKQFVTYYNICKTGRLEPAFIPFSLDYCIKDIVLSSFLHSVFRKSKKIVINDEGQLQRIVFLAVQYNVDIEDLINVYKNEIHIEKTIYIRSLVDKLYENILKRNRHVCAMDELDSACLKKYLTEFDICCEKLVELSVVTKEIL